MFRNSPAIIVAILVLSACTQMKFDDSMKPYIPDLPAHKNINVALILGGGGSKGLAHVGVIEELLAHDIQPDLIVGCSAGAIVGALYADTLNIHYVKNVLLPQERENLINVSLNFLPFGISDGRSLTTFLEAHLKARHFEELRIPFISVATNLQYGDMTAIGRGRLIPAVHASAAFPGIFTPVLIENQHFVDGGVANSVPAEVARKIGAKYVIAIELDAGLSDSAPTNMLGILNRCLQISQHHQSRLALNEADYIIRVTLPNVGTFDDGLNQEIYQRGVDVGRLEAPKIKKLIDRHLQQKAA